MSAAPTIIAVCPCGNTQLYVSGISVSHPYRCAVVCDESDAEGPADDGRDYDEATAKAVRAWNRHPGDDESGRAEGRIL